MNTQCYRLVFSKRLGMQVPVAETARSHSGKARDRKARARLAAVILGALAAPAWAASPAPNALPAGATVRYGDINIARTGNTLNINQATQNGVINWNSFSIGSQATVNFNQPNVTAATLNRIIGNEASVIQGALNATGAVYVINRNGILFDKGAQINLHTLVGSTLDIKDDDLFKNGFLSGNPNEPAFSDTYTAFTGSSVPAGMVQVAEGASITASTGGQVILLAPNVQNNGIIKTDSGQIILAAGHKAYLHLTNSSDSNSLLRGLLVEVESDGAAVNLGELVARQGDITLLGKLVKQSGVASATSSVNLNGTIHLLAQDINPDKPLKYLSSDSSRPSANETGDVVIGEMSRSIILPDLDNDKVKAALASGKLSQAKVDAYLRGEAKVADFYAYLPDATLQDAQIFNPSHIDVQGHTIWVQKNATLLAPGGVVNLLARQDPSELSPFLIDGTVAQAFLYPGNQDRHFCADCRVQVDDGARIDVSGLRDVAVPVERNVVDVELRGSTLADSPLLRDPANPLYAKTIKVDVRNSSTLDVNGQTVTRQGTPLVDASGYIAQIGRKIDEKSSTGGKVNLYSEGELVMQGGSGVNVSGGSIKYQDGVVSTSQLVYQGKLVDIASATPDLAYSGLGPDKTVAEKGYTEGKDAGTLNVVAPFTVLQGGITGTTVAGERQRGQAGAPLPVGATLNIGVNNASGPDSGRDYRTLNSIRFTSASQQNAPDYGTPLAQNLKDTLALDAARLKADGISHLAVYTNGSISIEAGQTLDMGPGGSVSLTGGDIDVIGNIRAPGGAINLATSKTLYTQQTVVDKLGLTPLDQDQHLTIGLGSQIVSAGLWTNDYLSQNATAPVVLDGGAITIAAQGLLTIESGSLLDSSSGGWLKIGGKTLAGGKGGDITLSDNRPAPDGAIQLKGELRSFGLLDSSGKAGKGGKLTLKTFDVTIGEQLASPDGLLLSTSFFSQGGFSAYDIRSSGNLDVASNVTVEPHSLTRILGSSDVRSASGQEIATFSTPTLLSWGVAKSERPATSLSLSARYYNGNQGGRLTIGEGAQINVDPKASVGLSADKLLDVEGRISAPGGNIELNLSPYSSGGYQADAAIWLGSHAALSAAGVSRIYPTSSGLRQGEVLDGGAISVVANNGYIAAAEGSVLDVSGTTGQLDLPQSTGNQVSYKPTQLASSGGTIRLAATEGLFMGATMRAAGGSANVPRGTLNVQLDRPDLSTEQQQATPAFLTTPRSLEIYASQAPLPTELSKAGAALDNTDNGRGMIAASQLAGFDHVSLKSRDRIVFKEGVDLNLRGRLALDTPSIELDKQNAAVNLAALYIELGNADPLYQAAGSHVPSPYSGTGQFNAKAQWVDLIGYFALSGAGQINLASDKDLRLVGVVANGDASLTPAGQMAAAGDLTLTAAQAYPTTLSDFRLENTQPGGRIIFQSNGSQASVPLSAGGSVTVVADNIEQAGVLRAPLGNIELDAKDQLTLADGSLTSVSAEGQLIPFGWVENGQSWVYDLNTGTVAGTRTVFSGAEGVVNLAEKSILLNGASIDQQGKARVDLSGGGDLYGYEFTPGPGGSRDYLSDPNVFAILPDNASSIAPFDFQYSQYAYHSSDPASGIGVGAAQAVVPGQRVYLSGIPGLAAGYYTLLPGHYALLPGAYAVRAAAHTQDMTPAQNIQRADGAYLVAGYQSNAGTADAGSVRWSGFEVASRDVVTGREKYSFQYTQDQLKSQPPTGRSEIHDYLAGQLIPQLARNYELNLPKFGQDAGHLGIKAGSDLKLDGPISFDKADGARGGELDISAPRIAVTNGSDPAGYVALDVNRLNSYQVDSLMLGGVRENLAGKDSVFVDQGADEVLIDTGADAALEAPEILLTAKQTITVAANSVIHGKGAAIADNRSLVFGRDDSVDAYGNLIDAGVSGDGALLSASSNDLRDVVRHNVSRAQGDLIIGKGAVIRGDQSATLDVTHNADNRGTVVLGDGGALHLGAARISVGDVSAVSEGIIINNAFLAGLGKPKEIVLQSYSNFDVYGDATLSNSDTQRLTLSGAGMAGVKTGRLDIEARTVSLANPDGNDLESTTSLGNGTLNVTADTIEFGQGQMKTAGFDQVNLTARGEIAGTQGQGGLKTSNDLSMAAQRLVGYNGSDTRIEAGGRLALANYEHQGTSPLPALGPAPLGARMTLDGAKGVDMGGTIDMPAGWLNITAENGDLNVSDGGRIFTGGVARSFQGVNDTVAVPVAGGQTTLQASHGNVVVERHAVVEVSGQSGADAGMLNVSAAEGEFVVRGQLKGDAELTAANPSPQQASLSIDAQGLSDGSATPGNGLSSLLQHMSGFGEAFGLRQRTGDMTVAAADTIKAQRVNLSVDSGSLDIKGRIDSSGASGGWVMAAAGREVYLRNGAQIDASATGPDQPGGEVYLISGMDRDYVAQGVNNGMLVLENGSAIRVGGTLPATLNFAGNSAGGPDIALTQVTGGRVHLQAPRLANGQDVRITQTYGVYDDNGGEGAIGASISGASLIEALGNKVFDYATLGASQMNAIKTDSQNYMGTAAPVLARLGPKLGAVLHVRPSVEVRSSGDLSFTAANYNLYSNYRFGGEPGTLTLRAQGNLLISENLSDGFDKVDPSGKLQAGDSLAYRLAAGADLGAADPMAVTSGGNGNFVLKAGKLIRTGTGAIQIAAAGDVNIGLAPDGTYDRASVIYTAGRADANPVAYKAATDAIYKKVAYGVDGGALAIDAGGSIHAPEFGQLTNNWLQRRGMVAADGNITISPAWGVAYEYFNQGVGALGGGDVRIAAGQNIENLSVSLPTTGRDYAAQNAGSKLFETGGGSASIVAGGDMLGSFLYVQKGAGRIVSGGQIGAMPGMDNPVAGLTAADDALDNRNLVLAMGDNLIQVSARNGLGLESVFNPTMAGRGAFPTSLIAGKNISSLNTDFFTYGADSAVNLVSAQGDVLLSNSDNRLDNALLKLDVVSDGSGDIYQQSAQFVYPGSLTAAALNGSLTTGGPFALYPSARGQLHLLAHDNVLFGDALAMSDVSPAQLPSIASPVKDYAPTDKLLFQIASGGAYHAPALAHAHDPDPVRVYAEQGSIGALRTGQGSATLYFPKPVEFLAHDDILDVSLTAQNLAQGQSSRLWAGRDIRYAPNRSASGDLAPNGSGIQLGGPGYLELAAGRNIDLGNTAGVITDGNQDNPALPPGSAQITLLAGMGSDANGRPRQPDYAGFAQTYLSAGSTSLSDFYIAIENYEILRMAVVQPENAGLSFAAVQRKLEQPAYRAAVATLAAPEIAASEEAFSQLPVDDQARRVFYHELELAGQEANQGKGYERAYQAIAMLFPEKDANAKPIVYSGGLSGFFSQIRTNQGGDIQFLAPGGGVTVGLVSKPADLATKDSELGVFTVDGGSIQSYTRDSFNVNTSRVFTLGQEISPVRTDFDRMIRDDILLFSQLGNIDAGKGAKTTTSTPPPTYEYDNKGNLKVNLANSISGSGIGVLLARDVLVPGNVSLIAPAGEVNAGDAGIRASGNLNIAAAHVVGADNIQVSGLSVGVPVAVDSSGLSFSGAGGLNEAQAANEASRSLSASNEEAQKSAQQLRDSLANFKLSFITAEVIGFGETGSESGDAQDCKKRNDCKK